MFLIVSRRIWTGEPLWVPLRGRRYKTRARAEAALKKLIEQIQQAAEAGRAHPDFARSVRESLAVVEIREGDDTRAPMEREGLPGQVITPRVLRKPGFMDRE